MKTHLTALSILAVMVLGFMGITVGLTLLVTLNSFYIFWVLLLVVLGIAYKSIYKSLKDKEENEHLGPFNSGGRD